MSSERKLSFPVDRLLIGSGAIGTSLRETGIAASEPVELLNLRQPEAVRRLHEAYRAAGAQILVTNTFAANRLALEDAGVTENVEEINRRGVAIARRAAGDECAVWASVGPLGLGLRLEDFPDTALREIYMEQCTALREADALLLETFSSLREARAALRAACGTGLPVVFQMGRLGSGAVIRARAEELLAEAESTRVAAIGVNCLHPEEAVRLMAFLATRTNLPLTVAPNAGQPRIERGRVRYEYTPSDFLRTAQALAALGAAVIGGCCGTTPDHIRVISSALRNRPLAPRPPATPTVARPAAEAGAPFPATTNPVRALIRSPYSLASVEIRADRARPLAEIVSNARRWADSGADLFDVPDNPGASVGRDAIVTAARLQSEIGIPTLPHLTATQSNLLRLHSTLLGAGDLGLRGLLALTGDAPSMGPFAAWAHRVTDVRSSVELLRLIRDLRQGRLVSGERVADPPDFCAGCALGQPIPGQLRWLKTKIEAGAEFVFTQPVFTTESYERLKSALGDTPVRVFFGVLPLTSARSASVLAGGRIPGIVVPPDLAEDLGRFSAPADQRRLGMERAATLVARIAADGGSLYLIPPFGRDGLDAAADLLCGWRAAARAVRA